MPNDLISDVRVLIRDADFVRAWPAEVKRVLAKALKTEGPIPVYATWEVKRAIREAKDVERSMNRQLQVGADILKQPHNRHLAPAKVSV